MGVIKYKGVTILPVPTDNHPLMVQVIKTSKKMNELVGKKFVNINRCMTTIESIIVENHIEISGIKSHKELQHWVVNDD